MKRNKMKWHQKIVFGFFAIIVLILFATLIPKIERRNHLKSSIRKRLRYFNPVITEGLFGKRVKWVGRDKPLTDEELERLF
jgi:hypothetical protein